LGFAVQGFRVVYHLLAALATSMSGAASRAAFRGLVAALVLAALASSVGDAIECAAQDALPRLGAACVRKNKI
jgi:hypothetical protein